MRSSRCLGRVKYSRQKLGVFLSGLLVITDGWFPLRYHEKQSKAWRSRARFVNLACGRGSGKTELARRRVARFLPVKKPWSDPLYFYTLPTYNQAKRVAWDPILKLIPDDWIKSASRAAMTIETVFGSKLYILGLDKPQRIEGVQWDGGVIDESCDCKPGTFARSVVPALEHRNAWCWRIGVPKRYGIGAAEFKEFFDRGLKGTTGIESYSWPSADILTEAQLHWAMENLDEQDFNEQYNANWEDVGGLIFHAFSESNLDHRVHYDPSLPIIVGSDFNVDPMAWVLGHRYPNALVIFDEIWKRNTNTPSTLNELFQRYGHHENGWEFYGDASGKARKTSADVSDYIHIKNDKRFRKARIFYPKANPRVARRFAATNAMLCNSQGQIRLKIQPNCKNLIDDLKYRAYKEGTREPDDHGDVGHITDALGYIIHRRFPIKAIPHAAPKVVTNG